MELFYLLWKKDVGRENRKIEKKKISYQHTTFKGVLHRGELGRRGSSCRPRHRAADVADDLLSFSNGESERQQQPTGYCHTYPEEVGRSRVSFPGRYAGRPKYSHGEEYYTQVKQSIRNIIQMSFRKVVSFGSLRHKMKRGVENDSKKNHPEKKKEEEQNMILVEAFECTAATAELVLVCCWEMYVLHYVKRAKRAVERHSTHQNI
eukprot:gene4641-3344_t